MCTKCGKRLAVVFITTMESGKTQNLGLCLLCAKDSNIPQISDYMQKLGITDEDIEAMSDIGIPGVAEEEDDSDPNKLDFGNASSLPPFMAKLFDSLTPEDKKNKKDNEKPKDDDIDEDVDEETDRFFKGIFANSKEESGENSSFSGKSRRRKGNDKKDEKPKALKFVDAYCIDLTKKAQEGDFDKIIGREKEIARVIQILSRRTKNNPCLIGEPGVGKTAVAEGIAQRIAEKNVPFNIADKRVCLLDMTSVVAGTQYRGQFEQRIKGLLNDVKEAGNIILFIDEVHTLVSAGDAEGGMNASNIFKPALSRGELQIIGATTFNEYRKYIEKDSALERRFQPVKIEEPDIADAIVILNGVKGYYEDFHRVHIDDYLVSNCVILSERYINDRFLPDKAIDLLDESCAAASIAHPEIGDLIKFNKELEELENKKEDIENASNPDYEALASVKSAIINLENKIDEIKPAAENVWVTAENIANVIELWTGIPAAKIEQTEFLRIGALEEELKKHIVGQDEAVKLLVSAIKRSRVQLSNRRRPASFIFVGPTGVGKTELAKVLSAELFSGTDPLIRLDMSEFMEKFSVSRIIGSPPGYVGYDDAGQLTEKVRRRPYSVVLFDEIEKAHPDVMNILLQILDEGKITDAQGRNVNFQNTIIIMTSNAGSIDKSVGMGFAKSDSTITKERAIKGLRDFLRPEFISRVDEIVVFNPLTEELYKPIAALMLDEMKEPLAEKNITIIYDDKTLAYIAKKAFDKKYGARDIRRIIHSEVEDKVATAFIEKAGNIKSINITVNDDGIVVETEDGKIFSEN
jgi:ATP-dependent Clp protease ATP-binding subunit ClpA